MNYTSYANRYAQFFENINENTSLLEYKEVLEEDVYFEDPFQKTYDINSLYGVFQHMYKTLIEPKFFIIEVATTNNIAYIQWKFKFKREKSYDYESFVGVSRIEFNKNGKVISHVDYWDSANNIYIKVPILGFFINFIKEKIKK